MTPAPRVVLDTNVLVAGLRSPQGASFRLLNEVGRHRFGIALSVPLVLECEDALLQHAPGTGLARRDVDMILDYFSSVAHLQEILLLWRRLLPDPKDDLVLEVAVAAGCRTVVSHNVGDFCGAESLGVSAQRPGSFLKPAGVVSRAR